MALFIISAPSGTGKTTLCKAVLAQLQDIHYSVSSTTREPRKGEMDGVDYHFISKEAFIQGIQENRWAEWAEVHGNFYGTSADFLDQALQSGKHVILDIDVQGALQILKRYPDSITIFIMPPSLDALKTRLLSRETDSAEIIAKRLENAKKEISEKWRYQYVIVNDVLSEAIDELIGIIKAHYIAPI